jgi:hypothetical protein
MAGGLVPVGDVNRLDGRESQCIDLDFNSLEGSRGGVYPLGICQLVGCI